MTPHDAWDYDGVNESILVDLKLNGQTRKALVHFDRNGFAYTLDRMTGELLNAQPFVHVNWAKSVDLTTGLPVEVAEKRTRQDENITGICPGAMGGKDQQPAAYSPRTGLFYVPTNNICMDYEGWDVSYIAGVPYVGANVKMFPGPGGNRGEFIAGIRSPTARSGASRRSGPPGVAPWSRRATSCSTARWTAGSRRLMPSPETSSGSSRSGRGS